MVLPAWLGRQAKLSNVLICNALHSTGFGTFLLVGFAWGSVQQVDDPAVGETMLAEDVVHDHVILVGVDADAGGLGERPLKQSGGSMVARFTDCDAVDDVVWGAVEPVAVVYPGVCRVWSRDEGHGG